MRRRAVTRTAGLILGFGLLVAVDAAAQSGGEQGAAIPAGNVTDVLRARIGKPVTLLLGSGKEYSGTVAEVRGEAVVLKSLSGKEFYDALIRLDAVSAIEIRNR